MKHFVFIIKSLKDGRYYKGMTTNLTNRIKEHNAGRTFSTKVFVPWELVYYEEYSTRSEARAREKFLKSGQGRNFIKRMIHNDE